MEQTKIYNYEDFNNEMALEIIKKVMTTLEKRGYNPINQIVGYLMSGDPGYITSYEGARSLLQQVGRSKILEVLLKEVVK